MIRKTIKRRRGYRRSRLIGRNNFRNISGVLSSLLLKLTSHPIAGPALLWVAAICLLLFLAPYIITKILPESEEIKERLVPAPSFELIDVPRTIDVYRTASKKIETLNFEDYVKGVVSGEMPAAFHLEALKAQSVAARTYSLARVLKAEKNGNPEAHPGAPLCDSTHCQMYRSKGELKDLKGSIWMEESWQKITSAVDSTKGQLLYYDGSLVEQALFHSSSGGKTENSEDVFASAVPYLISVNSPYEDDATHQDEENSFSIYEFAEKLKAKYPNISFGDINASNIEIISRSSGGRVEKMKIGAGIIEGRNVRDALALPSANFTLEVSADTITFTSRGFGHGVGMSQYGAKGMAEKGYDYKKILSHYYSGTEVY